MKKLFKFQLYLMMATLFAGSFFSCSDDDDNNDDDEKEVALAAIVKQYVNATVIPTYKSLADATNELCDKLVALKTNPNQANLDATAESWLKAREHWELSEAFLFGAVADFGIDPHIDTWPLASNDLNTLLNTPGFIANMGSENGDVWAGANLQGSLLGFHGIEYILFENGQKKNYSSLTSQQLIYAIAVAGDLRNKCYQLEAAWGGIENVTTQKREKLEELEVATTLTNSDITYGENMLLAGNAGSTYRTVTNAALAILDGCITISEEVGDIKIGNAYRGDDVNHIESPYSYNSKVDFIDNIESIANAYLGGADTNKRGASISAYIKSINPEADKKVIDAINTAIEKINAIPYPFKLNFNTTQAGDAIEACAALTDALNNAKVVVRQ